MKKEIPQEDKNRRALVTTTGILGTLMMGLLYFFPNGSQELKTTTFETQNRPKIGTGPVKIVVFSDYQCPACKEFDLKHLPAVKAHLADTGRITLTFMQTPIFGEDSQRAARAAECVYRQNEKAFWHYSTTLFEHQKAGHPQGYLSTQLLTELLPKEIEVGVWETCLNSPETAKRIQNDIKEHEKAGVEGTPAIFVNGKRAKDYGGKTIEKMVIAAENKP